MGTKVESIQRIIATLEKLLVTTHEPLEPLSRDKVARTVSVPGFFRYYFGKWIAQRRTSWSFPAPQVRFLARVLHSLMQLLDEKHRPEADRLISLRMDFSVCQGIIECRCHGLRELERAKWMEHFQQTEWLPTVKLEEVLGEPASRPVSPAKKIA